MRIKAVASFDHMLGIVTRKHSVQFGYCRADIGYKRDVRLGRLLWRG